MKIEYAIVRRPRRKSAAITISPDNHVRVLAHPSVPQPLIDQFIERKRRWIERRFQINLERQARKDQYQSQPRNPLCGPDRIENLISERLKLYESKLRVKAREIKLRPLKTLWGSCSSRETISLNKKLLYAPLEVLDYVIVHELVHLIHRNHSARFWKEVEKVLPHYRQHRVWLRQHGDLLEG